MTQGLESLAGLGWSSYFSIVYATHTLVSNFIFSKVE